MSVIQIDISIMLLEKLGVSLNDQYINQRVAGITYHYERKLIYLSLPRCLCASICYPRL